MHAEGAQVYDCKADASGKLVWQFREPIATLLMDGKTVGRHYAGPSWELLDGSAVSGKVAARHPGATASDIPLLMLNAASQRGSGLLSGVATIQRTRHQRRNGRRTLQLRRRFPQRAVRAEYTFLKKKPESRCASDRRSAALRRANTRSTP
jgi:hypothetical protein